MSASVVDKWKTLRNLDPSETTDLLFYRVEVCHVDNEGRITQRIDTPGSDTLFLVIFEVREFEAVYPLVTDGERWSYAHRSEHTNLWVVGGGPKPVDEYGRLKNKVPEPAKEWISEIVNSYLEAKNGQVGV